MTKCRRSRRWLLATGGAIAVGTLAGCLGGNSDGHGCSGEQRTTSVDPQGDVNAPVLVEMYSDFSCGHCATFYSDVYPDFRAEFVEPGTAQFAYQHFPIPLNDWSWRVPNAALAVAETTDTATYYEFVEQAFTMHGSYSNDDLVEIASSLGAEGEIVSSAIENEPFCEQLYTSRDEGVDRGVEGTPTVFVEGSNLGNPSNDDLRTAIELSE